MASIPWGVSSSFSVKGYTHSRWGNKLLFFKGLFKKICSFTVKRNSWAALLPYVWRTWQNMGEYDIVASA